MRGYAPEVYVAAKFEEKERVQAFIELLKSRGIYVTHDWTTETTEGKTGEALAHYLTACAEAAREGACRANVLVLFGHALGRGSLVELGIAIGCGSPVIVVGKELCENIFFHLPDVISVGSDAEALAMVWELARG